jgi:hypothetical protein
VATGLSFVGMYTKTCWSGEITIMDRLEEWIIKSMVIGMGGILVASFVGAGIKLDYNNHCKLELAQAGRTSEDIAKICR